MTDPTNFSRSIEYRGYNLVITRLAKQWQVTVVSPQTNLTASELEFLKGWQEEEVLFRARIRVDDILEHRHPR